MQFPLAEIDIGALAGPWPFIGVTIISIIILIIAAVYVSQNYRRTHAKLLLILFLWCLAFLLHEILEILNLWVGLQVITGKLRIFNNLAELFTILIVFYLISR
jgi:hypothetical protein